MTSGNTSDTRGIPLSGRTSREVALAALAETLVGLADTLVDDYDLIEVLDQLVTETVSLSGVAAAGLLLLEGEDSLTVVATSSEESRLLELFQVQHDEGPCLDCARFGLPVSSPDLSVETRWPLFVASARAAGFRSVLALPLRLRDQTIGGLNLFHDRVAAFSPEDQRIVQALADIATIGILQRDTVVEHQLKRAVDSRDLVERAKVLVSESNNISMDAALDSIRRYGHSNQLKLTDTAAALLNGEVDAERVFNATFTR